MSSSPHGSSWAETRLQDDKPGTADEWQATRAQTALATQFLRDKEDPFPGPAGDIGKQVNASERELFVSCAPALALQQQFEHLRLEFIAVHDIGTASSRKLLAGVAAAANRPVQKLYIRRQGFGTPLATLEFVELPTADGGSLRMFTTECDADTASRHGVANLLLAFSRLAVIMVGELPAHAIEAAFKPLRESVIGTGWHNRNVLLLPLASAAAVATQGIELARGTSVLVRTTPQVTRPADAWTFINDTWARLRGPRQDAPAPAMPPPSAAPRRSGGDTEIMPLTMRPMPEIPKPTARGGADTRGADTRGGEPLLQRYVQRVSELNGMIACCLFDMATGREILYAGAGPGGAELASNGSELLASLIATSRTMGLGHAIPEAAITLASHHLLLRPVPRHPGVGLHAVLDKTQANLTLARLQVLRLDSLFDDPQP
jgi:hypothetical protein